MTYQWKAAHDICSIEALNTAFEDCRDGEAYDLGMQLLKAFSMQWLYLKVPLEAIWQLVDLSTWFIDFLERLMKECIAFSDEDVALEVKQEHNTPARRYALRRK